MKYAPAQMEASTSIEAAQRDAGEDVEADAGTQVTVTQNVTKMEIIMDNVS
jgi:hypothetical protein